MCSGHRGKDLVRPGYWSARPLFALDADVTIYWPDVRPCWEESHA